MAAKKSKGADDQPSDSFRRLNVRVSVDSFERLILHAVKAKQNPGQLVDDLIREHLRTWKWAPNNTDRLVGKNRLDSELSGRNIDAA